MGKPSGGIIIRKAMVADFGGIMKLADTVHRPPYPKPVDVFLTGKLLQDMIKAAVFVAAKGSEIVGLVSIEQFFYDMNPNRPYYQNSQFAVAPEYRKGGVGDALLQKALEWCKEQGATEYFMGITTDEHAELKDRWMKRKGAQYMGGNFYFPIEQE